MSVLVYHDPPVELFERHVRYLARHYTFLRLEELVHALETNDWSRVPRNAVVITFDDGHKSNVELAPIFERYRIRPTIYLTVEPITTSGRFWFREPGVDPEPLKRVPDRDRRAAVEEAATRIPATRRTERHALDRDDVRALSRIVDFQSHSMTHPILTRCSARDAEWEIDESRREVAALSGAACTHFSFPNGSYGERELQLVSRAGYRSARTTDLGWVGASTDPFRLPMIAMPDSASVDVLATQLAGGLYAKRLLPRLRPRPSETSVATSAA